MYEQFFGLRANPFSLLPDANFLFLSKRHRQAANLLEYGNLNQSGFIAITGEVGAGKTTLIRHFLAHLDAKITVGVITNPSPSLGSLLGLIARSFSLEAAGLDDASLYYLFVDFLLAEYARAKRCVLIVDEAQNLTPSMLEELRMLSNVNNETDQLLQIILVGQPELLETLKRQDLRQLLQRIAVHSHLVPLEPAAYISHRLSVVGGSGELFAKDAMAGVHHFTGGVPRLINLLCDQALTYAYAEEAQQVTFPVIVDVVRDRNVSGLSAFLPLPDDHSYEMLQAQLEPIAQQMS